MKLGQIISNDPAKFKLFTEKFNKIKNKDIFNHLNGDLKNEVYHLEVDNEILGGSQNFTLNLHEVNTLLHLEGLDFINYLNYRYQFKTYPKLKKESSFPPHLLIEPVSYCNLKCVMCFQVDKTFTSQKEMMGRMSLDLFKKAIDEAVNENCRALTLASRGEPTLHPQLKEMLEYASSFEHKFYDFKLNTNATKLTTELSHHILSSKVNNLVFSVDSDNKEEYETIRVGGVFEKVFENIKNFKIIKEKHYSNNPIKTRVSGVLVKNQKAEVIESFWKEYVDEVALIRNLPRWDTYSNDKTDITSPCDLLWERLYLWFDGSTNPCDFDYQTKLNTGRFPEQSIKEIWSSKKFQQIRKLHLNKSRNILVPCDRCPL